ncbi:MULTISPECIES: hypothetical protein [Halorussus]|uniref:hypothetical protein n=1 Tax=Halorussus TaxID=1070314 RepID=UPI00209E66DB|nr:hypothetical protein [Halorussus vallis]USZ74614.1 hypothetical protein NGM07_14355 [Halorussus vallis]
MDDSPAVRSDESSTSDAVRPPDRRDEPDASPTLWRIRALLAAEAASFFLAAAFHAGVLVGGYEHDEAMLAETVIGAVLVGGLALTWARPRSTFSLAAGVQALALVGTLAGVVAILVGVGPRTAPDVAYHVVVLLVLTAGLRLAWNARGSKST